MQSNFFMRGSSASLTKELSRKRSLAFLLLLRIMWEVYAWKRLIFPEPVRLKRFFALECVFIFGIIKSVFSNGGQR